MEGTGDTAWGSVSTWLADPQNQARLATIGKTLDAMSRANSYSTSGQQMGPGAGSAIGDMSLQNLQPTLATQQKNAEGQRQQGLISQLLGSDLQHLDNPNISSFNVNLDENGNPTGFKVGATSQADLAKAVALRAQQQAGQIQSPAAAGQPQISTTPQATPGQPPISSALGGQSPF